MTTGSEPGEYFVVNIARSSVVVLRDNDREVAAFFRLPSRLDDLSAGPWQGSLAGLPVSSMNV
jgi:hypothetical protein